MTTVKTKKTQVIDDSNSEAITKRTANAIAKYQRISPYKVRRVSNLIRGKNVQQAIDILNNLPHKGARVLLKVVQSAKSNAVNNHKLTEKNLVLDTVMINEAPMIKRFKPRARGRMFRIVKRNSHISVIVREI